MSFFLWFPPPSPPPLFPSRRSSDLTTAIFSVVDATLLRQLPYPRAEQLVSIVDDLPGIGARDVGVSEPEWQDLQHSGDRKSTRLNSSHRCSSYAVFCLKKKNNTVMS